MSSKFDPYAEWLDISPAEQPADYYRLLGVPTFESNSDLIRDQADQRMLVVRKHQNGKRAKTSQRILNELSAARSCLLNERLRRIYDTKLEKILKENQLPSLAIPDELLPEETLPEDLDPFDGTAGGESDPLEPVEPLPIWPIVLGAVFVVSLIVIVILAAT